ncbi:hypothetical protein H8S45_03135 [Agathobaculum sp. NSJ-28]|uniref:Uncharacterized protein n=1 Tax=Agathobaculum faecis TaxID=2763013 RepID=A0A923LUN2_9FIRM|nr:hypothetical protein [Agathobaculum faecis]MBC5724465.1 hypothetical protein [Agathobaculum faecis]
MKELYKQTFSHLHASGSAFQEAGQMKTGRIRKSLVIGAAAAALMATAAGAANAATEGALLESIRVVFTGEVDSMQTNPDGSVTYKVKGEDGSDISVILPDVDETQSAPYTFKVEGEASADHYDVTIGEGSTESGLPQSAEAAPRAAAR